MTLADIHTARAVLLGRQKALFALQQTVFDQITLIWDEEKVLDKEFELEWNRLYPDDPWHQPVASNTPTDTASEVIFEGSTKEDRPV